MNSPCNWPVDYTACQNTSTLESADPDVKAKAEIMATSLLWRWTGQVLGVCPATIRPCRQGGPFLPASRYSLQASQTYSYGNGSPWTPVVIDGKWYNLTACGCRDTCGCSTPSGPNRLGLPEHTQEVTAVRIGERTLDPSEYTLTFDKVLVRTDGTPWPSVQDMYAPAGSDNVWEIDLLHGIPVPVDGQLVAGMLANEFAKALCGDSACALPKRARSVTRQGITVDMGIELMEDVIRGRTGITQVDSWVASMMNAPLAPLVMSPDFRPSSPFGSHRRVL